MALKIPAVLKNSTMTMKAARYLARGLTYLMKRPPQMLPMTMVTTPVAPVKSEALEAVCRYCSSMYFGLMM